MPVIFGINPVLEALQSQQSIEKIYIQAGRQGAAVPHIYRLAKNQKIPVVRADRKKIDAFSNGGKHQGVVALLPSIEYTALEALVEKIFRAGNMPNLLLLDRIQDPHNLGAIIRSAEVLGAQGVVVNLRDSAPITDVVVKASAGAIFHFSGIPEFGFIHLPRTARRISGKRILTGRWQSSSEAKAPGSASCSLKRAMIRFAFPSSGKRNR